MFLTQPGAGRSKRGETEKIYTKVPVHPPFLVDFILKDAVSNTQVTPTWGLGRNPSIRSVLPVPGLRPSGLVLTPVLAENSWSFFFLLRATEMGKDYDSRSQKILQIANAPSLFVVFQSYEHHPSSGSAHEVSEDVRRG